MKDTKFTIGLVLVILATITCAISVFLWLFAAPVFLAGAVLIFLSKKSIGVKLACVLIPLVLCFVGARVVSYFASKTTPETYLIPSDFEGRFRVVYGEPCGVEPRIEDGRRILEVPSNGVLIIKPEFDAGIVDHHYFIVDQNGNRTPLPATYTREEKNGVCLEGTGSIGGSMPDGSNSSESPLAIEYSDFYVNRGHAADPAADDRFDSLMNVQVEACRKK